MALRIEAQLHGDGSSFFAMMGKAELASRKLGATMIGPLKGAIAGAFSVGAAGALARSTIQMASHFRDLADQLGVNVEWLQAFSAAARTAGANEDDLAKMMLQVNKARGIAAGVGPAGNLAMGKFAQLGFSAGEVTGDPLSKFMEKIFKLFESGNAQALLPIMQQLGIRASAKLSTAFSEGILAGADEARKAGEVMAEDVIDQLDDIGDKWEILKTQMMTGIAPAIIFVIEKLQKFHQSLRAIGAWVGGLIFGGSIAEANAAADEERNMIAGEVIGSEKLNARRKRSRRSRENAPPGFIPAQTTPMAAAKNYSDSLTGVGNFLGAGMSASLTSIGEKTNQILNKHTALFEEMLAGIQEMGGGLDLGVP